MRYKIEHDAVSGVATVTVTGEYQRPADSHELKRAARDFYRRTGCHLFLFDLTGANVRGDVMETYDAATPDSILAPDLIHIRAAVLLRTITENDQFFENVAANRGFQVRMYRDERLAREWLCRTC